MNFGWCQRGFRWGPWWKDRADIPKESSGGAGRFGESRVWIIRACRTGWAGRGLWRSTSTRNPFSRRNDDRGARRELCGRAGLHLGSVALFPSCSVFTVPFPFSLRVTAEEPAAERRRLPPGFSAGARGSHSVPLPFPGGERLGFHPPPCLNSRSHLMQFLGRACMDSRDAAHGACGKFQLLALRLPAPQWEHSLGSLARAAG